MALLVKRDRRPHEAWEPEPLRLPLDVPPTVRHERGGHADDVRDERERPPGSYVVIIDIS